MDDDLIIRVGNPVASPNAPGRPAVYELGGWTRVRVQRSCEAFPSVFEISATERYPGDNTYTSVQPGDPCQVLVTRGYGSDVVLTGYVDMVTPAIGPGYHEMTIVGRSKCEDLVDCSAVWPTCQFNNMTVLSIAQNLAKPFGITVSAPVPDLVNIVIPQLVINRTETPYDVIERVARYAGLLVYDDENGNLVLTAAGSKTMMTGVGEGQNVRRASVSYSMNERFSEYRVMRLTFSPFLDSGANPEGDMVAVIPDGAVPRYRPRYIVAETPMGLGLDYAKMRGEWEASRRYGRAVQIRVTVDSWRDGEGNLWQPNSAIFVDLPSLKVGKDARNRLWLISSVTFRRDERGTEADLVIMPAAAFSLLPVPITPPLIDGPYVTGASGSP